MNHDLIAVVALILAALPCGLFLLNLLVYRPAPAEAESGDSVSVLIPARNEEHNIEGTINAALANRGLDFEVIVLDDHSTDRTAQIVAELARRDRRVRLESAPPLPPGWCGKQHACKVLAGLSRHPLLVFIDAGPGCARAHGGVHETSQGRSGQRSAAPATGNVCGAAAHPFDPLRPAWIPPHACHAQDQADLILRGMRTTLYRAARCLRRRRRPRTDPRFAPRRGRPAADLSPRRSSHRPLRRHGPCRMPHVSYER